VQSKPSVEAAVDIVQLVSLNNGKDSVAMQ